MCVWGAVHVPSTPGNKAILGLQDDGTFLSDSVRAVLCKPWEAMTVLGAAENADLCLSLVGPVRLCHHARDSKT